ncbi:MAG: glycosyltransferase family 4 protein [Lentisphaerae bacterium]|nr:glycosyltransferase family 4 protein [Lentisphaerota bacterium]MCP4103595.1 glycosyltransferase family 4 protein [Lentisphaerota bacterium]
MTSRVKSKNILYVSNKGGFFGGVERFIYNTASALESDNYNIFGMFDDQEKEFETFCRPFKKVFSFDDQDEVCAGEYDTVFIHKLDNAPLIRKLNSKFKTVVYVHDHDYYCRRRHKYFPVKRINCPLPEKNAYCLLCSLFGKNDQGELCFNWNRNYSKVLKEIRKCDRFVVMSEYMRDNLTMNGILRENVKKLYSIVDTPSQSLGEKTFRNPPVITATGQLIAGKGFDLLIDALSKLEFDFKAYIVGGGKDEKYLRDLSAQNGLQGCIEFTGWKNDVAEYYLKSDIAVFPSRWQEPFGLTGVEAAAFGLPVVGFDVGGVSEWLRSYDNGILVPPADTEAMAAAITEMVEFPDKAIGFGRKGREFVETEFSMEKFIRSFEEIIC